MDSPESTVGARVRAMRLQRNWSQAELGRRAGMPRSHIHKIEDGTFKVPRPENLEKIARALNCDVTELVGYAPTRVVTPYESNAAYRRLIEELERLPSEDRDEILRHALWSATKAYASLGLMTVAPSEIDEHVSASSGKLVRTRANPP